MPPRADWRYSVAEARDQVEDHITGSMRADVAADLGRLFERARRNAAIGLRRHGEREAARALPQTCAYSLDEIISHDWCPKNRHGIVDALEDTVLNLSGARQRGLLEGAVPCGHPCWNCEVSEAR